MKFGLEEWMRFPAVVTGAGVVRIWEMRRSYGEFQATGAGSADAIEQMYHAETKTLGVKEAERRAFERNAALATAEQFNAGRVPLWRAISGLQTGMDLQKMHPGERFGRMGAVVRAVERVVRFEWRQFRKKRSEGLMARSGLAAAGDGEPGEDVATGEENVDDPRVSWWDPLRFVCAQFEMAYSALSRFAREVAGLSASDLTDRVKAEGLKTAMRADVKRWLLEAHQAHPEWNELDADERLEAAWGWVQASRGRGKGSRASWACGHGFSSYTRFHKACLAAHGVSPIELERAVLEEVVEEGERLEAGDDGSAGCAELERAGGIQNSNSKIQNEAREGALDGDGVPLSI